MDLDGFFQDLIDEREMLSVCKGGRCRTKWKPAEGDNSRDFFCSLYTPQVSANRIEPFFTSDPSISMPLGFLSYFLYFISPTLIGPQGISLGWWCKVATR